MLDLFKKRYSKFKEEDRIHDYINRIKTTNQFIVDIGASDGLRMSNTYRLFKRGYPGIGIESNPIKFAALEKNYSRFDEVAAINKKATPNNVCTTLVEAGVPKKFLLLSLDIDGYDYYVLEAILKEFKPLVIVTEINESIPPPLKFKVRYDENFQWTGGHFFGYSISCLDDLLHQFDYSLIELHYNNAFLVSNSVWTDTPLSIEQVFDQGYRRKRNRKRKFPYNHKMEDLLHCTPQEAIHFLNDLFKDFRGKYHLEI